MFDMSIMELLKIIWPLLIVQLVLSIIGLTVLVKSEKVRFLPKWVWAIIIVLVASIGPIVFLIIGKERDV